MIFFYTKNDEWFLDSSIDIKQDDSLMRFDKMETHAEYSLPLTSQGSLREVMESCFLFFFFIVYRHWSIPFIRHFSVDFEFF